MVRRTPCQHRRSPPCALRRARGECVAPAAGPYAGYAGTRGLDARSEARQSALNHRVHGRKLSTSEAGPPEEGNDLRRVKVKHLSPDEASFLDAVATDHRRVELGAISAPPLLPPQHQNLASVRCNHAGLHVAISWCLNRV